MEKLCPFPFIKLCKSIPLLIVTVTLSAQTVFDDWRIRQPNPPANSLNTAIYAEGRFVAAGYHATVVTSATGTVWETRYLEPEFNAQGLVYAEDLYVMIDRDGYIATSQNLDAWFLQTIGASSLKDLTYADGKFVAVGRLSRLFVSDDGQDWTPYSVSEDFKDLEGIAYGNGYWVTVARGGAIFRSTDLENWTQVFAGFEGTENMSDNWDGLVFINGNFVAYGPVERILTSSDNGETWTDVALAFESGFSSHAEFDGKLYLSGENDAIIHSTDGLDWERFSPGTDVSIGAIAASPDRIVGIDAGNRVLASDDGQTWSVFLENDIPDYSSIAYKDGLFITLADKNRILRSADGVNWTVALDVSDTTTRYEGVAVLGDRFLAVNGGGAIAWSTDAVSWDTDAFFDFTAIVRQLSVANDILFAGCDSGIIAYTTDGIGWTEVDIGIGSGYAFRIEQVSYFNGTYFAAGGNGTLASSTNLEDWTLHPVDEDAVMEKLMYYNGRYILLPVSGSRLLFSDDLETWTDNRRIPIIRTAGAWVFDGLLVIAGSRGSVYTSEDGETFIEHPVPASTFRDIAFDGQLYVAVGSAGVIATTGSDPLSVLNLTIQGEGEVARSPDQALYDTSTLIRLTARPASGQRFLWWETTDGPVYGQTFELSLNADTNITAVFANLLPPALGFQLDANTWFFEWINDPDWVLHESSNLVDWQPVSGVESADGTGRLANQTFPAGNRFFQFRVRSP